MLPERTCFPPNGSNIRICAGEQKYLHQSERSVAVLLLRRSQERSIPVIIRSVKSHNQSRVRNLCGPFGVCDVKLYLLVRCQHGQHVLVLVFHRHHEGSFPADIHSIHIRARLQQQADRWGPAYKFGPVRALGSGMTIVRPHPTWWRSADRWSRGSRARSRWRLLRSESEYNFPYYAGRQA